MEVSKEISLEKEQSALPILMEKINKALEQSRPYLQIDGGDIEFVRYEENNKVAIFRFLGNCSTCPMSIMTLRAGIERWVLYYAPEIRRIEVIR